MICATLKEAKVKLNTLVQEAVNGEDVILMRGAKHIAAIIPISEDDLCLDLKLTDTQADRLWRYIEQEREEGKLREFDSSAQVVADLAQ